MSAVVSTLAGLLAKAFAFLMVANEIRGLVLPAPVFYGLYQAGGTLMAIWMAICSLAGLALSVIVPLYLGKRVQRLAARMAS